MDAATDAALDAAVASRRCRANIQYTPPSPPDADPLTTLNPTHPRLFVTSDTLAGIRTMIGADAIAQAMYSRLVTEAASPPPAVRTHQDIATTPHATLLAQSRAFFTRIRTFAAVYLLSPNRSDPQIATFRDQAIQDMLTVSAFPDWYHCDSMLDVGEMAMGVAVGYDWLYDTISPADRATIVDAMVRNALNPAILDLNHMPDPSCPSHNNLGWLTFAGNQSEVDAGGIVNGALAIADPATPSTMSVARSIVVGAQVPFRVGMSQYAVNGGWHEGVGYWDYGTSYAVRLLAAAQTALGTDFGIPTQAGFRDTGTFRLQTTGPLDVVFNFADFATVLPTGNNPMFWLARQFDLPLYMNDAVQRALHEAVGGSSRDQVGPHGPYDTTQALDPFDLILYDPGCPDPAVPDPPLGVAFLGAEVATMRTAWRDPQAAFVGFKAGDNAATHVHYDTGTFVLDLGGQRWGVDLGDDSYALPGYFGANRLVYYRTRTEGHNTLSISTNAPQTPLYFANQDPQASTQLVAFAPSSTHSLAVADLTPAYTRAAIGGTMDATRVVRGIAIVGAQQVLVEDEITTPVPVEAIWNFHTFATVQSGSLGNRITLTQNGTTMVAEILTPVGATFTAMPADPAPRDATIPGMPTENHNTGVSNVYVRVMVQPGVMSRIVVRFTLDPSAPPPAVTPLADWIASAPIIR